MVHEARLRCQWRRGTDAGNYGSVRADEGPRVTWAGTTTQACRLACACSLLRLRELSADQPHPATLGPQACFDLLQALLNLRVLPVLDHGALLFLEPLLFDSRPLRQRSQERLVFMRNALAQMLDMRMTSRMLQLG